MAAGWSMGLGRFLDARAKELCGRPLLWWLDNSRMMRRQPPSMNGLRYLGHSLRIVPVGRLQSTLASEQWGQR